MQPPTYREIIQQLLREGFVERASAGDYRRFSKNGYKVTVSQPDTALLQDQT